MILCYGGGLSLWLKNVIYMKEKIEVLKEVSIEVDRFKKKLNLAIKEQSEKGNYSSRHYASSKRAALDLKNELTKLTQDSKYRWS